MVTYTHLFYGESNLTSYIKKNFIIYHKCKFLYTPPKKVGIKLAIPLIYYSHLMNLVIQDIYNLGARSFWIHNTGPIGCLPYIFVNFPLAEKDENGCAKQYNEVAQYFNHKLKEAVIKLRDDLPLAAITYVDIYSVKYSLYNNPKKYGKSNYESICYILF